MKSQFLLTKSNRKSILLQLCAGAENGPAVKEDRYSGGLKMLRSATWKRLLPITPLLLAALCLAAPAFASGAGGLVEGSDFPHFTAKDMSGKMVDTKAYSAGKVMLLDFWSIYCTSCLQEMPFIIDINNRLKDKGLVTLSMDMDSFGVRRVEKFIQGLDFKIPYPTIIDEKRDIGALLKVSMLPTVILVDTKGKVKLFHVGYQPGFEKELEKLILDTLGKK
jgi:thiol-disulfide isomerase/thioredoxin